MRWISFEKELPQDGQHILILTRGCSSSAAEAFFIKSESVEKYYNSGLVSEEEYKEINKIKADIEMSMAYGNIPNPSCAFPKYYIIVPIFSGYEDDVWINCECFSWIPFPDED